MPDPKAGKYHRVREYREGFQIAATVLDGEGGTLNWSTADYEAFRYEERNGNVRLIFYPHRTTARNYHLRVRDGGSYNKVRADALMERLNKAAGYNCTFTRKHSHA